MIDRIDPILLLSKANFSDSSLLEYRVSVTKIEFVFLADLGFLFPADDPDHGMKYISASFFGISEFKIDSIGRGGNFLPASMNDDLPDLGPTTKLSLAEVTTNLGLPLLSHRLSLEWAYGTFGFIFERCEVRQLFDRDDG